MQLTSHLSAITPSKLFGWSILLILPIVGFIFGLNQRQPPASSETTAISPTVPINIIYSDPIAPTTDPFLNQNMELVYPQGGEQMSLGSSQVIRWDYFQYLLSYSENVSICLFGYDNQGNIIKTKEQWRSVICTEREGNQSGSYLISTEKLTNLSYNWPVLADISARFDNIPNKYKVTI